MTRYCDITLKHGYLTLRSPPEYPSHYFEMKNIKKNCRHPVLGFDKMHSCTSTMKIRRALGKARDKSRDCSPTNGMNILFNMSEGLFLL